MLGDFALRDATKSGSTHIRRFLTFVLGYEIRR